MAFLYFSAFLTRIGPFLSCIAAPSKFIGRPVDKDFWGTRTQHIVGVAGCLAITDHASQQILGQWLGRPLCFAKSPATFVAHTFFFIFSGVTLYCAGDAVFNPYHKNRMEVFKGEYFAAIMSQSSHLLNFELFFVFQATSTAVR